MILHLEPYYSPEDLARLKEKAKEANDEFVKWVAPFYSPKVKEAMKRGFKMQIGVSHFWLEGWAGLRVMLGGDIYEGQKWLHISVSRIDKLPGWREFTKVKELFFGDVKAIQVFPVSEEYVNDNPYVLHFYSKLKGMDKLLPDFRIVDPRQKNGKKSI